MKSSILGISVFSLCLAACSAAPDVATSASALSDDDGAKPAKPNLPVQMNDLTVVFPLATTQADFDDGYLKASTSGNGGALIPQDLYEGAIPPPPVGVGGSPDMAYADLRIVAVRFDPCFANVGPVTDASTCDNQMRLVLQSLSFSGGQTSAMDGAVHAFYSLTRSEFVEAVSAMTALRGASDLGPLTPHPLLVSEGLTGAFGKSLSKLVTKYAGAKTLTRFTHFISGNLQTNWTFIGFDVANSATTPMIIPTLPKSATSVEFAAGFALPIDGTFTPETTSSDDESVLTNIDTANAATADARQAAYDAALRIQNPNFNSPNTIDCASCHVAQNAQVLMGEGKFGLSSAGDSNAFVPDSSYVSAADFAQTTSPNTQTAGFNVHMVSYKDSSLSINQRVINETAAIMAYVNGQGIVQ